MVASKKILVVDDDATVLNEVTEILADEGFDLIQGTDGKQALALVRDETPDLVVMDVEMPGMGGHGFLDTIRLDEKLSSCVVFVLTTSSADTDIRRAYERQIAGYFVKDIDSGRNQQVIDALRAYMAASWLPGDA